MGHIKLEKLAYRKDVKKWLRSRYGDEAENIWKKSKNPIAGKYQTVRDGNGFIVSREK
ncbi:MAG: hypothetical protein IKH06_01820 [Clostridiales bacterium]|nr:hypothetical protein [Clostridiales bacterium]